MWLKHVSLSLLVLMDTEVSGALVGVKAERPRTRKDIDAVRQRMRRLRQGGGQDNSKIGSFSKLVVLILYAIGGNAELAIQYLLSTNGDTTIPSNMCYNF